MQNADAQHVAAELMRDFLGLFGKIGNWQNDKSWPAILAHLQDELLNAEYASPREALAAVTFGEMLQFRPLPMGKLREKHAKTVRGLDRLTRAIS